MFTIWKPIYYDQSSTRSRLDLYVVTAVSYQGLKLIDLPDKRIFKILVLRIRVYWENILVFMPNSIWVSSLDTTQFWEMSYLVMFKWPIWLRENIQDLLCNKSYIQPIFLATILHVSVIQICKIKLSETYDPEKPHRVKDKRWWFLTKEAEDLEQSRGIALCNWGGHSPVTIGLVWSPRRQKRVTKTKGLEGLVPL